MKILRQCQNFLVWLLVFSMVLPFMVPLKASAAEGSCFVVNGESYGMNVKPYYDGDALMVEATELADALSLEYVYNSDRGTFTLCDVNGEEVVLMHNATQYYVGEEVQDGEVYFYLDGDDPMVNVEFVCGLICADFAYDEDDNVIVIDFDSAEAEEEIAIEAVEEPAEEAEEEIVAEEPVEEEFVEEETDDGELEMLVVEKPEFENDYSYAVGLYNLGFVNGYYPEGLLFGIYDSMPRLQTIMMIVRLLGVEDEVLQESYSHPFVDVPEEFDNYVGYAYENNLTAGVSAYEFAPDRAVSEAEFLTLILRAIGYDDSEGDFEWDNPYDLACEVGVCEGENSANDFLRGDAFRITWNALYATAKDGASVYNNLIEAGMFTYSDLEYAVEEALCAEEPEWEQPTQLVFEELCYPPYYSVTGFIYSNYDVPKGGLTVNIILQRMHVENDIYEVDDCFIVNTIRLIEGERSRDFNIDVTDYMDSYYNLYSVYYHVEEWDEVGYYSKAGFTRTVLENNLLNYRFDSKVFYDGRTTGMPIRVGYGDYGLEEFPTVSVGRVTGAAGDSVKVKVSLKNNTGFGGIEFGVTFDNSLLTLANIDSTGSIAGFTTTPVNKANQTGKISFNAAGLSNVVGDGTVATLTFKISEDAEERTLPLNINIVPGASFYYDGTDMIDLDLATEDGSITVREYIPGDPDNNGTINIRDAALILQFIAGWEVSITEEAADVDNNGTINIRDAARILQYIAGWDVTLG